MIRECRGNKILAFVHVAVRINCKRRIVCQKKHRCVKQSHVSISAVNHCVREVLHSMMWRNLGEIRSFHESFAFAGTLRGIIQPESV